MKLACQRVVLVLTASTVWWTSGWGLGQEWSRNPRGQYATYQNPTAATAPAYYAPPPPQPMDGAISATSPILSPGQSVPGDAIILPPEDLTPRPAPLCDDRSGRGYCCPPQWYFSYGAQVLGRNRPGRRVLNQFLAVGPLGTVWTPRLTNRTESFGAAPGVDLTFGKYLGRDVENRDRYVEFTFWGLHHFELEAFDTTDVDFSTDIPGNVRLTGALRSAFFNPLVDSAGDLIPGFDSVTEHFVNYEADLNNYEVNLLIEPRSRPDRLELQPNGNWVRRRQTGWFWSYQFGVRYLELDEHFTFGGRGTATYTPTGLERPTRGEYGVLSHNDFVGLQLGGELFDREERFQWGVRARVCPGVNFADQESIIATHNPFGADLLIGRGGSETDAALFGDVSLLAEYIIVPRLVAKMEYDFMFLTGFALAAEQVDFRLNAPETVNNGGFVYAHGLTLALESRY